MPQDREIGYLHSNFIVIFLDKVSDKIWEDKGKLGNYCWNLVSSMELKQHNLPTLSGLIYGTF
ncbi:MAG: hypothetical protein ACTMUB_04975 [cyanobacterium endosymbiont of Rhopalodia musculus]|uniref:hypothetical protein n=1 Tax=cyanobacterium endosymbiont of Epithemia clementina EcSB TaxID=3034674 RepID=UPI00247FF4A2|nr:hypothetical protein [cyanobacterium endosymbiont of Epithemia clementina EcSB]WGT67508.1 hypothetical protein P3F56_10060 [cyanobacterium endosymbiont of Epithemia clementina EcSB]